MKSNAFIGDASLIGLECESGDFTDCNLDGAAERVAFGCEDILIFSDINSTCGSMCGSKRNKRSASLRTGWTLIYMSQDSPMGNGDHENYFDYVNRKRDRLTVYDLNGEAYTNCEKKAIHIR